MLKFTKKNTRGRRAHDIQITDEDGNIEIFSSVKEAAKKLDIHPMTIYRSIVKNTKIFGQLRAEWA